MKIRIRQAVTADVPILRELIDASVRGLQTRDYTPSQIESALATVYGVDTQLIADGTYLVAEAEAAREEELAVRVDGARQAVADLVEVDVAVPLHRLVHRERRVDVLRELGG